MLFFVQRLLLGEEEVDLGRHHLSNATCLIRTHVFSVALLV